ncbi:MAG TPA: xanthine dehydrogenase family protein molybdopterin-binding subunit [Stellaceae bacterium]|nr:xanthine dehydrogenase family protein molybdopterin-binding subunit [Stellaceae bacterium]
MSDVRGKSRFGIGASLPRKEDARHMLGRGQFVADVKLPGTEDVAFVRSPHAHARIKRIAVPPGAEDAVYAARDLPRMKAMRAVPQVQGFKPSDYPPLATDKVRFAGEAIAACIAPTRAEAEDIANAVTVEYEVLPPIVDAASAVSGAASLLHEPWGDNLFIERTMKGGDIDAAARDAAVVVRRDYRLNRQAGVPLEGRAVLAYRDHRLDELVVYSSTQVPHTIRLGLSETLGIEERRIRVIAPDVGGGFGIKARLSPEEVVLAALALERDHPVRWIEDRSEHLMTAIHTRDHLYRITAYADSRGRILGIDAELVVDAGAYALWPNGPFLETGMAARNLPGPYDIAGWRVKTFTVATNKSPIGPYRGVGRPGACFALERTIDEVARAVGRDPLEVRIENMVRPEQMPFTTIAGMVFDNGDYRESARRCADLIDLAAIRARQRRGEPDGRLVGIGFAAYAEQTGHGCGEWVMRGSPFIPGYESCTARLMSDGSLALMVGIQSHGQGLETTLAQVAHEVLGIDPARIAVRHGDTSLSPFGMGTLASRSMVMAGGAVTRASRLLQEKILKIGAHLLQCDPADVRCAAGMVVGPGSSVSIDEIARVAHLRMEALPEGVDPLLDVTATYEPELDTGVFSYATQAAVVAVDPRTGLIELLDFAVVEDCGTVVNPMIVDGQIRGGVVQGIGNALYEELIYDAQGQPQVVTLADYLMPGAAELPAIKIGHLYTPTPYTEFGVKGMGEGGAIAPPAAIGNAVRDALAAIGAEVNETPMTPRRVMAAIRRARKSAPGAG